MNPRQIRFDVCLCHISFHCLKKIVFFKCILIPGMSVKILKKKKRILAEPHRSCVTLKTAQIWRFNFLRNGDRNQASTFLSEINL